MTANEFSQIHIEKLVSALASKKLKITFAESCTGGLLSAALTDVPGSSAVFEGAVCCYSDRVKSGILGVDGQTLERYTAVSAQSAYGMALNALKLFKADIAVAVTGYAGIRDKDLGIRGRGTGNGTVYICVLSPNEKTVWRCFFSGDRQTVRKKAVRFALKQTLRIVCGRGR